MRGLARHEHNKKMIREWNDAPVAVDVKKSIIEMRAIYSSYTHTQFLDWYSRRYGVSRNVIAHVLAEDAEKRHSGE